MNKGHGSSIVRECCLSTPFVLTTYASSLKTITSCSLDRSKAILFRKNFTFYCKGGKKKKDKDFKDLDSEDEILLMMGHHNLSLSPSNVSLIYG